MRTRPALRCEHLESRDVPTVWTMPGWTEGADTLTLRASDVPAGTTEIVVQMGGGNDRLNLISSPTGVPVKISAGTGDDTANIGADLNLVNTRIEYDGQTGRDGLSVSDLSGTTADRFTITRDRIALSRLPGFEVKRASVEAETGVTGTFFNDQFDVTDWGVHSVRLNGSAGNDSFTFTAPTAVTTTGAGVTMAGGAGADSCTLNYSAETAASTFNGWYDATTHPYGGWHGMGLTQMIGARVISRFVGIEVENSAVIGGSGNDLFNMTQFAGSATTPPTPGRVAFNGGGGTNTLASKNSANAWTLSGVNTGILASTGFSCTTTFSSMQNLTGYTGTDTLTVTTATASLAGVFDGGSGSDTVVGPNVQNRWELYGKNSGSLRNGQVRFVNTESVTGGSQFDVFVLLGTFVGLDGTLDGGLGSDQLITGGIPPVIGVIRSVEAIS